MEIDLPRITVITPSFNQGEYLEQTILSVLSQAYPNLEYIIIDGGSTDNSIEIIKKYSDKLSYWHSKKDNGQSNAINIGFQKSTGDILCWLNSDDIFFPGIFTKITSYFININQPEIVYGNSLHYTLGKKKARGSDVIVSTNNLELEICDYIIQPSSFWTRIAWLSNGPLNEKYTYGFDWEWYIRLKKANTRFIPVIDYLSIYRLHNQQKSTSGGSQRINELIEIVKSFNSQTIYYYFEKWMNWCRKKYFILYNNNIAQL